MNSKPLLYGLIGFFLGGLLVSIAATTFANPVDKNSSMSTASHSSMSMDEMTAMLRDKTGNEFDEAFLASMIEHHNGAVGMAKLAATNAKHDEVKQLSENIITTQNREKAQMLQWQKEWNYKSDGPMVDSAHQ